MVQAFYSVTAVLTTRQLPKNRYVVPWLQTVLIAVLTVLFSHLSFDGRAHQLHLSDRCIDLFQDILVLRTPA